MPAGSYTTRTVPLPPPVIEGVQGSAPRNLSGYGVDLAKLAAMPPGVFEIHSPKSMATSTEQMNTRMYVVPWSERHNFREWALGFSDNVLSPGDSHPTGQITRVIPAQDPDQPYLFCSRCELDTGAGALVIDPNNFAHDAKGNVLSDANGKPILVPTVAYADNQGGSFGVAPDDPPIGPPQPAVRAGHFRDGAGIYRLTFTTRSYRIRNDDQTAAHPQGERSRYTTFALLPSIEGIPLARVAAFDQTNVLTFRADSPFYPGKIIPEAGLLILPGGVLQSVWYEVPDPDFDQMERFLGTVNANPMYLGPGRKPAAPGTLLFQQPDYGEPQVNAAGRTVHTVKFRWSIKPGGWNSFPTPKGLMPATFGGAVNGDTVYKSADHNKLWSVQPPVDWFGS